MTLSRRAFLFGSTAVVAVSVLPAYASPDIYLKPPTPNPLILTPKPPRVAYFVGTPGDMNGEFIRARSPRDAWEIWCANNDVFDEDNELEEQIQPFDAESVHRVEAWDDKKHVYDSDLFAAGFSTLCSKCGYERNQDDGQSTTLGPMVFCFSCVPVGAAA